MARLARSLPHLLYAFQQAIRKHAHNPVNPCCRDTWQFLCSSSGDNFVGLLCGLVETPRLTPPPPNFLNEYSICRIADKAPEYSFWVPCQISHGNMWFGISLKLLTPRRNPSSDYTASHASFNSHSSRYRNSCSCCTAPRILWSDSAYCQLLRNDKPALPAATFRRALARRCG